MSDVSADEGSVPRRTFLKLGAAGGAALALGSAGSVIVPDLRRRGLLSVNGLFDAASIAGMPASNTVSSLPMMPWVTTTLPFFVIARRTLDLSASPCNRSNRRSPKWTRSAFSCSAVGRRRIPLNS